MAQSVSASSSTAGTNGDHSFRVDIRPYAGEEEIETVMGLIDGELSEPYTIYTYRYFLNQWPQLCFLAYLDDGTNGHDADGDERVGVPGKRRAVGVVIGKLDRHNKGQRLMRGYIGMISVETAFRGRGIAKRLLHVTLSELVKRGAQEIVLETEIDNVASLRLYESVGFMREKRLYNFYLNGKDCYRLVLQLPPSLWQLRPPAPMPSYHDPTTVWPSTHSAPPLEPLTGAPLQQSQYIGPQHDSPPQHAFRRGDIL